MTDLCQIILEAHASESFRPEIIGVDGLVSHIVYLFNGGRKSPWCHAKVWMATQQGPYCLNSQIYMTSEESCSPGQILAEDQHFQFSACSLLYTTLRSSAGPRRLEGMVPERPGCSVATLPRLACPINPTLEAGIPSTQTNTNPYLKLALASLTKAGYVRYTLHSNFRVLMHQVDPLSILQLLRFHWQYYKPYFLTDNKQIHYEKPESVMLRRVHFGVTPNMIASQSHSGEFGNTRCTAPWKLGGKYSAIKLYGVD